MGRQTRSEEEKAIYVKNLHRYKVLLPALLTFGALYIHLSRIGQIVMKRAFRPWLTFEWLFKLSALGRENQECVKVLHEFTNQVNFDDLYIYF